jgi:hypothetical protein
MRSRERHPWQFARRFRRNAFGWRSQPAIHRVREAVSEIKKVARRDPVLGADGAVLFLEKVSPALEHVDSSSGAIGAAVNRAIEELASVIAKAPVDLSRRAKWIERLWDAYVADAIPYIETLSEFWGELCASKELASAWADNLLGPTSGELAGTRYRGVLPGDAHVPILSGGGGATSGVVGPTRKGAFRLVGRPSLGSSRAGRDG